MRALLWGPPHRGTFFDTKSVVKLLIVHQRPNRSKLPGRVRINRNAAFDFIFSRIVSPNLSKGKEETLFGRETINLLLFRRILFEHALKRVIGNTDTAQISDVLTQSELTVY